MGEETETVSVEATSSEVMDILASVPKGLDDDTKALLKMDNFPRTFETLKERSLAGDGCAQVRHAWENRA